ncbi:MAG: hypothetical protein IKV57_00850 [Clostridia bacterium]|nr:hypothetical protein [Clostridia bacterium]
MKQDFQETKPVTVSEKLRFAGASLFSHLLAFWAVYCIYLYLYAYLEGSALFVLLQIFFTLPISILLPRWWMKKHLPTQIPRLYTLADDPEVWYKKALRLILPTEILRFLMGLLPFPICRCGLLTSPVTYLLYTLVYVIPLERYDAIMVQNQPTPLDTAVFLGIYCAYFIFYNLSLMKRFRKEAQSHIRYLEGQRTEKERTKNYRY